MYRTKRKGGFVGEVIIFGQIGPRPYQRLLHTAMTASTFNRLERCTKPQK